MTALPDLLELRPGVTAFIGGGGKTTLLRTLADLLNGHSVLLCTTTKIYPFPDLPNLTGADEVRIAAALKQHRAVCVGEPLGESGKLSAPAIPVHRLAELAEFVLVEADGSAGRPLKAHAFHEPVIPPESSQTIFVAGASGFGLPVFNAAHRPERYAELADVNVCDPASPESEARVRLAEGVPDRIFLNQAEEPSHFRAAGVLAERLPCPILAGSLWKGVFVKCW